MLLKRSFFCRHPVVCARGLIGCALRWGECSGIVVETEAYCEEGDEACHTFSRASAREFVAAHEAGTAYVYLSYGMHWLANVLVKSPEGCGFVLLRALEPVRGLDAMRERRGTNRADTLCSGPARLTQALGIDGSHHGASLCGDPAHGLRHRRKGWAGGIIPCTRIGITKAVGLPWRFCLAGCPHVSRQPSAAFSSLALGARLP